MQHSLGLNSLCYLFFTPCRLGLACDEELSLQDVQSKKKICVYRALTFSSCIALPSQSISPFIQGFIHLPLLKPAAPLLPSLLLLYYVSSLPPSFSLSALVLDSGRFSLSRLRRMGLQLMTFLVRKKKTSFHFLHPASVSVSPVVAILLTSPSFSSHRAPFLYFFLQC